MLEILLQEVEVLKDGYNKIRLMDKVTGHGRVYITKDGKVYYPALSGFAEVQESNVDTNMEDMRFWEALKYLK